MVFAIQKMQKILSIFQKCYKLYFILSDKKCILKGTETEEKD